MPEYKSNNVPADLEKEWAANPVKHLRGEIIGESNSPGSSYYKYGLTASKTDE